MKPFLCILTLVLLFFPEVIYSQSFERFNKENFFFASTEVDPKNAIFGSSVNKPAYDGVVNVGYRKKSLQAQVSYESFSVIKFSSIGIQVGHVFNCKGNFNYALLGGLSLIQRKVSWLDKEHFTSASLSGQVEYHFLNFYILLRGEERYREDLGKGIASGYAGIGVKI